MIALIFYELMCLSWGQTLILLFLFQLKFFFFSVCLFPFNVLFFYFLSIHLLTIPIVSYILLYLINTLQMFASLIKMWLFLTSFIFPEEKGPGALHMKMFVNHLNISTSWMVSGCNRECTIYTVFRLSIRHIYGGCTSSHTGLGLAHRKLLSARPYSQPFFGCWTFTVIISPLEKGSRVGLEAPGWWATFALKDLPPPPPPCDSPVER